MQEFKINQNSWESQDKKWRLKCVAPAGRAAKCRDKSGLATIPVFSGHFILQELFLEEFLGEICRFLPNAKPYTSL